MLAGIYIGIWIARLKGKMVKVEDDANHHDLKLVSDFLKEANEEMLLEIFLRLPNCRSALLFGSVCQCWHSLISQPQFIPRFISHHREHQDRYSLPYTIIFRKADKLLWHGPQCFQPICKLFSDESMFIHGKIASTYLDFLPSPMVIKASCDDLLLVSPNASSLKADRYICNPITKQYYKLPEIKIGRDHPESVVTGHGLVCMPNNQFKVVELRVSYFKPTLEEPKKVGCVTVRIFSSESGKWQKKIFPSPRPKVSLANFLVDIVTCNGILYWLEYERDVDRVIALDLLNSECSAIVFPDDFWWFRQQQDSSDVREQIGVVGGELRLLQVVLAGRGSIINFKVWKLNDKDSSWFLVHDKKNLTRPSNEEEQLVAPFVHPTDGDVVFMVWGRTIFRYNLIMEEGTYEMIDDLQESLNISKEKHWAFNDRLISFPMVHPAWPTPLHPAV